VEWFFRAAATKYVTSQPEEHEGRLCRVWVGLADAAGVPLDAVLYGDHAWEVFVGRIDALAPADDWLSWELRLSGLEAMLNVQIGGEDIGGYLHPYGPTGGGNDWSAAQAYFQGEIPWGQNRVKVLATDAGGSASIMVEVSTGSSACVIEDIGDAIQTALNADPTLTGTYTVYGDVVLDEYYGEVIDGEAPDVLSTARHSIWVNCDDPTATVVFRDCPGNCLFRLGFTLTDMGVPSKADSGNWHFKASEFPLAYYLGTLDEEVQVYVYETDLWPASGYIRLGDGADAEVAHYSTKTTILTSHVYTLALDQRGALGTVPREIALPWAAVEGDLGDATKWVQIDGQISVQVFVGFEEIGILTAILRLICSTGTAGIRSASYDIADVYPGFGAALRLDVVDVDRFEHLEPLLPASLTVRSLTWQESLSLSQWMADELAFLGLTLQGRRLPSGRFKLTLDQVAEPTLVSQTTLTSADLDVATGIKIERVSAGIVNQGTAQTAWNAATQQFEDRTWEINDIDSQEIYGKRPPMEIRARGLLPSIAAHKAAVEQAILSVLSHYSRPYELVTIGVRRGAWRYQPGDQIALTHAGLPRTDGTRGWTAEPLIVLAARTEYVGSGRKPAAMLTCLHLGDRRLTYYVPSALVASYDAGGPLGPTLTLADNEFSDSTVPSPLGGGVYCKDIRWFDLGVGALIQVANEGEESSQETATIAAVNVTAGTIVLAAPLVLVPGARCVIYYPDYDDCNAAQKLYIHLADTDGLLGAADDPAMQYGG
jgi:hypothetical protein